MCKRFFPAVLLVAALFTPCLKSQSSTYTHTITGTTVATADTVSIDSDGDGTADDLFLAFAFWQADSANSAVAFLAFDAQDLVSSSYAWTLSGTGNNIYYVRTAAATNPLCSLTVGQPCVRRPYRLFDAATEYSTGTLASLANHEWNFGDQDSLGYNTVYWRSDIVAPGALTVGAATSGGSCTDGTHSYKVTFITAAGETEGGTTSAVGTCTGPNNTLPLSAIPVGQTGTTQRKVYRTVTGDTGNHLLLTTIADNTTTTFSDTIADGSLGAAVPTSNSGAGFDPDDGSDVGVCRALWRLAVPDADDAVALPSLLLRRSGFEAVAMPKIYGTANDKLTLLGVR